MKEMLVFVYGTLKNGYGNNRILQRSSEFVSNAVTEGTFALRDCGFPYMTPADLVEEKEETGQVRGEVWRVKDEDTLRSLDALEGEGSHYHRKVIEVNTQDGKKVEVQTYLRLNPRVMALPSCPMDDGILEWRR